MTMNVLTEKGLKSLAFEREAVAKFLAIHPRYDFVETPKEQPSAIDGVLVRDGVTRALVEARCRKMTRDTLRGAFGDTWMVTMAKLEKGRTLSELLCLPFVGMLYLLPERVLIVLDVTDDRGEWKFEFERRVTTAQKCINGGLATRLNAFLPLATAKEYT